MASSSKPVSPSPSKRANIIVRLFREIYHPLGFKKGYNFSLFFIFAGALLGFTLARLQYLNYNGVYIPASSPGEGYWQSDGHYKTGLLLHLSCILPAALLVILQFVPAIRYKVILFHRLSGYVVILLVTTANAGALMIARRAFGGAVETQAGIGLLAVIVEVGLGLAYWNIRHLQIDQHRAWMLRSMFAMSSIITLRLILILATLITTSMQNYYIPFSCAQIAWFYSRYGLGDPLAAYPACSYPSSSSSPSSSLNATNTFSPDTYVAVNANFNGTPEQIGASLDINFGMALWLALFLHLVGVEVYLRLTPGEARRLRAVSAVKQRERGYKVGGGWIGGGERHEGSQGREEEDGVGSVGTGSERGEREAKEVMV
ncbi:hypothetical protein MMC16_004248 [Acarospora aff. strigata]|nr:hypothetical protein [Acarospora aff. strigata]